VKVLICGANGFLGSSLLEKTIELNWVVDCFVHKNMERILMFEPNVNRLVFSTEDLIDEYDIVYLLSTKISYQDDLVSERIESNIEFPLKIAQKCKSAFFIYSSSISLYKNSAEVIKEKSIPDYENSFRYLPELIVKLSKGFTIIRFSSIIGRNMHQNRFIPAIIKSALEKGEITLFGNGSRLQNYIPIQDATDFLIKAGIMKIEGTYLGVYPKEYSNVDIANIVVLFLPNTKIVFKGTDSVPSFRFNNLLTRKSFCKEKFTPIDDVIKKMIVS
jgi:nucleoside-diphosphate-sugar epimerase